MTAGPDTAGFGASGGITGAIYIPDSDSTYFAFLGGVAAKKSVMVRFIAFFGLELRITAPVEEVTLRPLVDALTTRI